MRKIVLGLVTVCVTGVLFGAGKSAGLPVSAGESFAQVYARASALATQHKQLLTYVGTGVGAGAVGCLVLNAPLAKSIGAGACVGGLVYHHRIQLELWYRMIALGYSAMNDAAKGASREQQLAVCRAIMQSDSQQGFLYEGVQALKPLFAVSPSRSEGEPGAGTERKSS